MGAQQESSDEDPLNANADLLDMLGVNGDR